MLVTAWSARTKVDVAVVEVDGHAGLRRAEVLTGMLRRAKVPVVHLLRGASLADAAALEPARVGRLLASSVAAVCLSGHLLDVLRPTGGAMDVIVDPVEMNSYPHRVRRTVTPSILWICGGERADEPATAVEVLRLLTREGGQPGSADAQVTLVAPHGWAALGPATSLASDHGLADRVTIAGPLRGAAAQELFAHHDVYVNAGDVDQAPIGIAEAMAAGLCVISVDRGGAGYLVADGVDGLLVDPGAPAAVASAVERLLAEPDLAERLSRAARSRAEAFDWARALPRWRNLLVHAAAGRGES